MYRRWCANSSAAVAQCDGSSHSAARACGADRQGRAGQGRIEPLRLYFHPRLGFRQPAGVIFLGILQRRKDGDDAKRQQAGTQDEHHLETGRKLRPPSLKPVLIFQASGHSAPREATKASLSELAKEIEHLWGNVFVHRLLVDHAQAAADFGRGGTFLRRLAHIR